MIHGCPNCAPGLPCPNCIGRDNYGPETDTWEDRGYPGPPVCRCGHERDKHGSRTEQRNGEKVYVQKCEQCPCEVFVDKDGPLSRLIDSFGPIQRYGTIGRASVPVEGHADSTHRSEAQ